MKTPETFTQRKSTGNNRAGNSWFQPVIGYSLPVFITIILTLIGVWAWSRWQEGKSK